MLHDPRFYRLDSDGRGKYLLQKGDDYLHKGSIAKAKKYFEEARKYCDEVAVKRLEQLGTKSFHGNNQSSPLPIQARNNSIDNVDDRSWSNKLNSPYFPVLASLESSPLSVTATTLDLQGSAFTFQDAPSTLIVANMFCNANNEEKKILYKQINKIIQQFDGDFSSPESIQELSVLASIPDQQIFIAIITQLLDVEKSSSTLPELTIHGLAVILASTPTEVNLQNRQGLLSNILERLQYRLQNIRIENNSEELLPLLRALSSLFDVMLCRNMGHLAREEVYNPIVSRLSDIAADETVDPEVSFLAHYTTQSLAYIGNDESLSMCIFRRGRLAFGILMDLKSMVFEFDPEKFSSIYEKIVEMSDFTIKLEWYQGLLFLDCLLGKEDLSSLEKFVIETKLNSNEYFMQGVCLRLEQLISSHSNNQVVQGGVSFLQDIESNSTGIVQKTASTSLNRLRDTMKDLAIFSSRSNSFSSTVVSINSQLDISSTKLPAIWNKYWYSDSSSYLLKSVQAKQNAEQSIDAIHYIRKFAPTLNSMDDVNKALLDYYASQLTIRRVSGDELGLEACYINLAIVEADKQRTKEKENLESQSNSYIRLPNYEDISATNTATSIPLDKLLDERKLINGTIGKPKRLLIVGRAGVGKTTFCKKLVHTFQSGQWNDQFGAILWIPLRQLKQYKSRNLEDLLIEKYFIRGFKNKRDGLAHEFISGAKNGRVLFLLDGLDEFVAEGGVDDPLRDFLITLLEQPNIIVTSRPYGSDRSLLKDLDLELETVGFSKDDVKKYVQVVISNTDESKSVMEFIQKTPLIQGLVNIPVQLDLICYSWNDLSCEGSTTITQLYQTIVRKLWCKDAMKMGKEINSEKVTEQLIKDLSWDEIDENMETLVEFLGFLAFRGLKNNHTIIFDQAALLSAINDLRQHRKKTKQPTLPTRLLEEAKRSSVLHTTDSSLQRGTNSTHETWNFIHLTFQEYFAASWISKCFQSEDQSPSGKSLLMDKEATLSFIRVNKYNPRFEIVWWMVAGQLEGEALESYFQFLQDSPRDLIGPRHSILLSGCYREADSQLSTNLCNQIEEEFLGCLEVETKINGGDYGGSLLIFNNVFHDRIIIKLLKGSNERKKDVLMPLHYYKFLSQPVMNQLNEIIKDPDMSVDVTTLAIRVLGLQSSISDTSAAILVQAFQDGSQIRNAACLGLSTNSALPDPVITSLLTALHNTNADVRIAACQSLSNQTFFSETTTDALLSILQDDDSRLRQAAVEAFSHSLTLPNYVTLALLNCLNDDDHLVRCSAIITLSNQPNWSELLSQTIIATLQDEREDIKSVATKACHEKPSLPEDVVIALVNALKDTDISFYAFNALITQSKFPESAISLLLVEIGSDDPDTQNYAIQLLSMLNKESGDIMSSLINSLQDGSPKIRSGAIEVLGNKSTLPEQIISKLITALHDDDGGVRSAAAVALCSQSILSNSSISALISALKDDDMIDVKKVVEALQNQSTLSKQFINYLIKASRNEDDHVRGSAICAIAKHVTTPDILYPILVDALQDAGFNVKYWAAASLSNQGVLPEFAISALVKVLPDEDRDVGSAAVKSICSQPTITTALISAIIASFPYYVGNINAYEVMLNESKIYSQLKNLSAEEIGKLYTYALFEYSCKNPISLFIHENKLHVYSKQLIYVSEPLSQEEIQKIVSGFLTVQQVAGIDMTDIYLK